MKRLCIKLRLVKGDDGSDSVSTQDFKSVELFEQLRAWYNKPLRWLSFMQESDIRQLEKCEASPEEQYVSVLQTFWEASKKLRGKGRDIRHPPTDAHDLINDLQKLHETDVTKKGLQRLCARISGINQHVEMADLLKRYDAYFTKLDEKNKTPDTNDLTNHTSSLCISTDDPQLTLAKEIHNIRKTFTRAHKRIATEFEGTHNEIQTKIEETVRQSTLNKCFGTFYEQNASRKDEHIEKIVQKLKDCLEKKSQKVLDIQSSVSWK